MRPIAPRTDREKLALDLYLWADAWLVFLLSVIAAVMMLGRVLFLPWRIFARAILIKLGEAFK